MVFNAVNVGGSGAQSPRTDVFNNIFRPLFGPLNGLQKTAFPTGYFFVYAHGAANSSRRSFGMGPNSGPSEVVSVFPAGWGVSLLIPTMMSIDFQPYAKTFCGILGKTLNPVASPIILTLAPPPFSTTKNKDLSRRDFVVACKS